MNEVSITAEMCVRCKNSGIVELLCVPSNNKRVDKISEESLP